MRMIFTNVRKEMLKTPIIIGVLSSSGTLASDTLYHGYPHIGNLRTAIFSYLLARQTGGQFILRIEDTDRKRYEEGRLAAIKDSLEWLGLDYDEGPDIGGPYAPYTWQN
jgi:hypothetical protein